MLFPDNTFNIFVNHLISIDHSRVLYVLLQVWAVYNNNICHIRRPYLQKLLHSNESLPITGWEHGCLNRDAVHIYKQYFVVGRQKEKKEFFFGLPSAVLTHQYFKLTYDITNASTFAGISA